jgi:hypothetical protein
MAENQEHQQRKSDNINILGCKINLYFYQSYFYTSATKFIDKMNTCPKSRKYCVIRKSLQKKITHTVIPVLTMGIGSEKCITMMSSLCKYRKCAYAN